MISHIQDEQTAYEMGYNAARFGTTNQNCHPKYFKSKRLLKYWQQGLNDGNYDKRKLLQLKDKRK